MRRMLVTAGPTHEPIDAVRYIANRSSGKMGIAIAEAARDAGWNVTLLLGPVDLPPPANIQTDRFVSTDDLRRLLDAHSGACDVLIMAAAVADYRPAEACGKKLPRAGRNVMLELVPTPDLGRACAQKKKLHQRIVGFALEETARLDERALHKLRVKGLDAIVANPLETMGADSIDAKVFTADGKANSPTKGGPLDKQTFAKWLVGWIAEELVSRH